MTQDTDDNTASAAAITQVLAYLDGLSDDAAAHIYPSDLEKCMTSECVVEVASVRAGNGYERTVPLFSREQVAEALAAQKGAAMEAWQARAALEAQEPTDAEIIAALRPLYASATAAEMGSADDLVTARTVLAKWGTPAPVGGEPVAWRVRRLDSPNYWIIFLHKPVDALMDLKREVQPLYTTPQPTQTQAGAVPLTCEWTHNEDDGFWETACGEAWRFDDGGPGENNMHFCHSCGNSLRIKGGQHGADT